MKCYRKLKDWEIIQEGDIRDFDMRKSVNIGWRCDAEGDIKYYRPIASKPKAEKYSYIARIRHDGIGWIWGMNGVNGKFVCVSKRYSKYSYAVNMAKSFCSRVKGVKLELEGEK